MMLWKKFLLLGTVGCSIVLKKMGPMLSRLAKVAEMELQGIPFLATSPTIEKRPNAIKIGILGAANIAPSAVIWPAYRMNNVIIEAVAARDANKATKFAKKYNIPIVHQTYKDLVEDPTIDAIYNPLPNGYHAYWTIQALKNGKHVLCEKPFSSNAEEAQIMKDEAETSEKDLILVEAFHYRFHPMMHRLQELITEYLGGDGIKHVEGKFHIPFFAFPKTDIRFNNKGRNSELAGGVLMDLGCYAINFVRHVMGAEPSKVQEAKSVEIFPGVDAKTEATLEFPTGSTATIVASAKEWLPSLKATIVGRNGKQIKVNNFFVPFVYHKIDIYDENNKFLKSEQVYSDPSGENDLISTYEFQLNSFVNAIQGDKAALQKLKEHGSPKEAIQNMKVIDMIYQAAGLQPRRGLPVP